MGWKDGFGDEIGPNDIQTPWDIISGYTYAPARPSGPGHFRKPRFPGPIQCDFSPMGNGNKPPPKPVLSGKPISMRELMRNVENVTDANGNVVGEKFDWRTPFWADGKWVLVVDDARGNADVRKAMRDMLSSTPLAKQLNDKIFTLTHADRLERAAWILQSGELGKVQEGKTEKVERAIQPKGIVVGYVHSHPTIPNYTNPPSAGSSDNDFVGEDYTMHPIQLVVESEKGRVWGQFPPRHTSILGRITKGIFEPLDEGDPVASTTYEIWMRDVWDLKQSELKTKQDAAKKEEERKKKVHKPAVKQETDDETP